MKHLLLLLIFILTITSCETNPPTSPDNQSQQFGKVLITANVSDAQIWLDNDNTGKIAPDTIETTVGTHIITLKKTDYLDASSSVEVVKDSLIDISITLIEVSQAGKIFVTSNAIGAQIIVDQVNTGKLTPDTIYTSPGNHEIELQRAFYNSSTQQIEAIVDSVVVLDMFLEEKPISNVVLIEDFANVSCVPCVTSNKILESLTNVRYGHSKLVAIKFPTNFPSPNDPFYLANPSDCNSRISYYNVFFTPTTVVDGIIKPISTDSLNVIAAVDQRLTKEVRFRMDIYTNIIGSNYSTTVTVKVLNAAGIDFSNCVLHTVITETNIEYATPPGSNGETKFYDVMRVMLPTNSGQSLNGISQTDEVVFQTQTTLNPNWIVSNLHSIAYIQNLSTKEVYQACSTFD